uniref:Uncharacterized protein n=1 Tax=Rhizophagus irregularis (strain DAOM 181602 / DAOM 197198 / MUCL 43194) TaxID=747089 RepID=U9T740_RHIID
MTIIVPNKSIAEINLILSISAVIIVGYDSFVDIVSTHRRNASVLTWNKYNATVHCITISSIYFPIDFVISSKIIENITVRRLQNMFHCRYPLLKETISTSYLEGEAYEVALVSFTKLVGIKNVIELLISFPSKNCSKDS